MKKFASLSLIFIFQFLSSLSFGQVLEQGFEDEAAHFRIRTPNEFWHMEPRGSDPGNLRWLAKFQFPVDLFIPNVTVQTEPSLGPDQPSEDWFQKNLQPIEAHLQILEKNKVARQGINGYEVISFDEEREIVFHQWFFSTKQKNFILTATSKLASYPRMEREFKQIFNSFEII